MEQCWVVGRRAAGERRSSHSLTCVCSAPQRAPVDLSCTLINCPGIDFPCFTHLIPPPLSTTVTSQNKPPAHEPQCPPLLFQESLRYDRYISLVSLPYKVPQAAGLKQQTESFLLPVLETGSPRSRCQQGWSPLMPLFLGCRWPTFHVSCLCTGIPGTSVP